MNLNETIKDYFKLDQQEKQAKAKKEPLNKMIKAEFKAQGINYIIHEGIKADVKQQTKSTVNEDKLLQKLKDLGLTECIKVVEVPDLDKIEEMLYHEQLDPQIIADCTTTQIIDVLTVKEVKGK